MRQRNCTPFTKVPDGHVRVAPLQGLAQLIRALGGNPETLFRSLKLDTGSFSSPDNSLPLSVRGALLEGAAAETGCEHIGLLIGSKSGALDLGIPGRLLLTSATVGEALQTFQQHWYLHNPSSIAFHARHEDQAVFGYSLLDGNVQGMQQLTDGAMALALQLMRQMLGDDWCPSAVSLMRREPRDPAIYSTFFGAPCRFNEACSKLHFPVETLVQGLRAAGGKLNVQEKEFAEKMRAECVPPGWRELVHRASFSLLMLGDCSQQRVAETLSTSTRTLNRRLEQLGLSYLHIIEQSRFAISRMLMKETDMPLAKVAEALGYTEPSSFSRAFRRWAGCPPEVWRKEKNGPAWAKQT